ncbi:MAG: hypothetical protein II411_03615 [Lachnospiraceae bacterium]|nr:hypothetical protein [Lachnospiraceae bacterium]
MKHTIITDIGTGYSFDQIIENEIEYGPKWAELGWFEDDRFENGHYYYFSNYYGSEGGYYNEETDELIESFRLEEMEPEEAEKIQDNCEFVEYPIDRELSGLHVDYDKRYKSEYFNEKYSTEEIQDENGIHYWDGRGIYQYFDGLFYPVEMERVEDKS